MIVKHDVYIPCFETMRTIHIYLPPEYDKKQQHYPVLYMYDGHNLFYDEDATFGVSWGLREYLDQQHMPLIVVGIECNHIGNRRLEEFSPYDFFDTHVGFIHGRGHEFMEWLVTELKPWIDQTYRTKKDRKYTGIAGSSMGGLMSLYTILHYNDTFSKAACLSSFITYMMPSIQNELKQTVQKNTSIYISWGSDEFRSKTQLAKATANNLIIVQALSKQHICLYPNIVVHGKHNEATWSNEIPLFMPFLFK